MKLTNAMRNRIQEKAIEETFKDRCKLLAEKENKLAEELYKYLYPPKIQKIMSSLPEGFFGQSSIIYVKIGESTFSESYVKLHMTSSRKVAQCDFHEWNRPCFDAYESRDEDVSNRAINLRTEKAKLDKDKLDATRKISSFLNGFTSTKYLLEEWPWCKEILAGDFIVPTTPNLPAIKGTEIIDMLESYK